MEEQNQPSYLETQWRFPGSTHDPYYLASQELNRQCMAGAGIDGIHYVAVPSFQWIHHQQTQHYVEFLQENVVSDVQMDTSAEASGFRLLDGSADMTGQEHTRPYYEEVPLNNLMGSEHQTRESIGDVRHASGPCSEVSAASYPSKRARKSREKSALSDRLRRMRIAERIEALGELFPCSKQHGRVSLLDDIIDHIKHLQFQIKDLSRSRLGGEPTSIPFVFLEGCGPCGHYVLDEQLNEPLEETMAKLVEVNPSMATQLLESKGLFVMPMALSEGLHHHE